VRDVLEVLAGRWPAAEVLLCPVRVQGEGAALEVAAALKLLNQIGGPDGTLPIDVLLIARGGGSMEDLWAFNEEPAAHAIYQSRIPVITGIGHEDDLTIADLVADQRALTPTDAAMRAVPDRADVLLTLEAQHSRLQALITRVVLAARSRLERLADRPCLRRPVEVMRDRERRIDELAARMKRAILARIDKARARLEATAGRLEGLSPLAVLSRGYSLTFDESGRLLRDVEQVRPGERIRTRLARGEVTSVVEGRGK
jgi:exodeoxyribonuclease VII large subunit